MCGKRFARAVLIIMNKLLLCAALATTALTAALPVTAGPAPGYMDFMRPGRKPVLPPPTASAPAAPTTEQEQKTADKAPAPAQDQNSSEKAPAPAPEKKPADKAHASATATSTAPEFKLVTSGPPKNATTHLVNVYPAAARQPSATPAN